MWMADSEITGEQMTEKVSHVFLRQIIKIHSFTALFLWWCYNDEASELLL